MQMFQKDSSLIMLAFFTVLCCFLFTEKDAKRNALLTILLSSALVPPPTGDLWYYKYIAHLGSKPTCSGVSTRLEDRDMHQYLSYLNLSLLIHRIY